MFCTYLKAFHCWIEVSPSIQLYINCSIRKYFRVIEPVCNVNIYFIFCNCLQNIFKWIFFQQLHILTIFTNSFRWWALKTYLVFMLVNLKYWTCSKFYKQKHFWFVNDKFHMLENAQIRWYEILFFKDWVMLKPL